MTASLLVLALGAALAYYCWLLMDRAAKRAEGLRRELEALSNDRVLARLRGPR